MIASLESIKLNENESFYIGVFQDNFEKSSWHYHNKFEISFITEGNGKRIVADSIEEFHPGDLIFIGRKLPHVWIPEKNLFGSEHSRSLESVYLQFDINTLPIDILVLPEFSNVKKALKLSERGLKIEGETLNTVSRLMLELPYIENFKRMLYFYEIMDTIGRSDSVETLASEEFMVNQFKSGNKRINKIHEYLMNHYMEDIDLESIAKLIHMAPGSVCRFFKSQTGATLFDYLNKIKVDYACGLLLNKEISIANVAFDCGFNNISHFNKQFKKITGQPPTEYRKHFKGL